MSKPLSLSAELRAKFLTYESAVATHLEQQALPPPLPNSTTNSAPGRLIRLNLQLSQWEALPEHQKQEMCDLFEEFFGMDDKHKQRVMAKVPQTDRQLTEQTVQAFSSLPADQRDKWIKYLRQLVNMSPNERQRLMETAAVWDTMPQKEREIWKKYVEDFPPPLPPSLPPLPPGLAKELDTLPPMPPGMTNLSQVPSAP